MCCSFEQYLVGEIESHAVRSDQRSTLISIHSDYLAESKVENMRTSVIAHDKPPPRLIDVQFHLVANSQRALEITNVHDISTTYLHVLDSEFGCLRNKNGEATKSAQTLKCIQSFTSSPILLIKPSS